MEVAQGLNRDCSAIRKKNHTDVCVYVCVCVCVGGGAVQISSVVQDNSVPLFYIRMPSFAFCFPVGIVCVVANHFGTIKDDNIWNNLILCDVFRCSELAVLSKGQRNLIFLRLPGFRARSFITLPSLPYFITRSTQRPLHISFVCGHNRMKFHHTVFTICY
jgi:hypothetical protein